MGFLRLLIISSSVLAQLLVCLGAETNFTHLAHGTASDDHAKEPESVKRQHLRNRSPARIVLDQRNLKTKSKGKTRLSKGGKGKGKGKGKNKEELCYPGPGEVFITQLGKPFDGNGFEYVQLYFPTCKARVVAGVVIYIFSDGDDADEGGGRALRRYRRRTKVRAGGQTKSDGTLTTCTNGQSLCDNNISRTLRELGPNDNFDGFFVDGTAQYVLCPEGRQGKGKGKGKGSKGGKGGKGSKKKGKGKDKGYNKGYDEGDDEFTCEGGDTYGDGSEDADFTGGIAVRKRSSIPEEYTYVPPPCEDNRTLEFLPTTCGRKLTKDNFNHSRGLDTFEDLPMWDAESWVIKPNETVRNVPNLRRCNRWPEEEECTCPPVSTKSPSSTKSPMNRYRKQ